MLHWGETWKSIFLSTIGNLGTFIGLHIENSFLSSLLLLVALSCLIFQSFELNAAMPELQDKWTKGKEEGWFLKDWCTYLFQITVCGFLLFRFYQHCFLPKPKSEIKLHRHLIEEAKPLKSKCVGLSAAHSSQQEGYSFMGTRAVTCGQKKWPVVPSSPVWCLQQRPDQMLLWKIKRKKTKGRHHCKQLQGSRNSREVSSPKAGCWHMLCSHGRRHLATSYRIKP